MTKFQLPSDVTIKMDGNTVTLSRGVINFQELNIDQKQSNPLLISTLDMLIEKTVVNIDNNEVINDLLTLTEMGYLEREFGKVSNSKILFIVDGEELEYYKKNIDSDIKIISADELSMSKPFNQLKGINGLKKIDDLTNELADQFELNNYDHIFWIDTYYHTERIRIFNKIVKLLNKVVTFSISDYSLFLITTIQHGETGCFECLENQVKTKLNNIELLNDDYSKKIDSVNFGEKSLKFGFTCSILDSLKSQGNTNTHGNVIEFDVKTMEYYFDSNRIQTSCSVCATQNNVFHEEQNMKTIEILNSLEG